MSTTTPKNRTTRRSRPATTDGPAADAATTDGPAADAATTDGPAADAATTDGPAADAATTDGPAADAATTDGPADDAPTTEDPAAAGDVVDGGEVTWADAVPWLALQVGSHPSGPEVAYAVPVWQMLNTAPGSTMLRLAADAELNGLAMDPAVITKILTRYQRAGIARAEVDGPVTRWSPITPAAIIAEAKNAALNASASAGSRTSTLSARVTGGAALRPGGLRQAIVEFLAEHPYEDWSPTQISKQLGNSSGAIANALEKLVTDGTATLTSQRPRRFQHAGATDATGAMDGTGAAPGDQQGDRAEESAVADQAAEA